MATFSITSIEQLACALEKAGFNDGDITALRGYPKLGDLRNVIRSHAQIVTVKHIVDMDADPYVPQGWKVESHKKQGQLECDPGKIQLYLSENQKTGKCIEGNKLREELESQPTLNANLLDYFLAHQELIPEEWKDKYVFFRGTVYRDSNGNLCVRCLYWSGYRWYWSFLWLVSDFDGNDPAAVAGK